MELVKDEVNTTEKPNMSDLQPQKKSEPIKYDPSKKYKWEHNDTFVMSGTDFGAIMNGLATFLHIYGPPVKLAEQAFEAAQNALKYAVENGVAAEMPNEEPKK